MKMLKVPKTEIKTIIREFEKIKDNYRQAVNPSVAAIVIHPDLASRMKILKKGISGKSSCGKLFYYDTIHMRIINII